MVDRIREVVPDRQAGLQQLARASTGRSTSASRCSMPGRKRGSDVSALRARAADERRLRRHRAGRRSRRAHPHLPARMRRRGRGSSTTSSRCRPITPRRCRPTISPRSISATQGMLGYVKNVQRAGNPPGHRLREAPEHVGLRHRRRSQGIFRRRGRAEGGRRAQHDEPVRGVTSPHVGRRGQHGHLNGNDRLPIVSTSCMMRKSRSRMYQDRRM